MGGSIFLGGTDDGFQVELGGLWVNITKPFELELGVLDLSADVSFLQDYPAWFFIGGMIPTYPTSVSVSYIDPHTSYDTDFYMDMVYR